MVICKAEAHCRETPVFYESECWEDEKEEVVAGGT